jgi:putative phage-type endonuclease
MTPELRLARCGKMTASRAPVVMGGLDTKGLADYVKQIAWERVYGPPDEEGYKSAAMERGTLLEAEALSWYAFETSTALDQEPDRAIDHPTVPNVAASPDALRPDRVVEAKCPMPPAWMEVKRTMKVPAEYRWQARWQMWCCGLSLADFVCYHPSAGGIIIAAELSDEDAQAMADRVPIVEAMIAEWVAILEAT